jgi:hypothetical protein
VVTRHGYGQLNVNRGKLQSMEGYRSSNSRVLGSALSLHGLAMVWFMAWLGLGH